MKTDWNKLGKLFLSSLKIGLFTFGGGYAVIPLISKETVERRHWISDDDILEIVAIAESTPGPIAINSATFVGYKVAGVLGAAVSTFAMILPSFVIILSISFILKEFEDNLYVKYAFNGIRAGVLALIIKAMLSMYRQAPKGVVYYVVMAFALFATAFSDLNVLLIIIICAVSGYFYSTLIRKEVQQ